MKLEGKEFAKSEGGVSLLFDPTKGRIINSDRVNASSCMFLMLMPLQLWGNRQKRSIFLISV